MLLLLKAITNCNTARQSSSCRRMNGVMAVLFETIQMVCACNKSVTLCKDCYGKHCGTAGHTLLDKIIDWC